MFNKWNISETCDWETLYCSLICFLGSFSRNGKTKYPLLLLILKGPLLVITTLDFKFHYIITVLCFFLSFHFFHILMHSLNCLHYDLQSIKIFSSFNFTHTTNINFYKEGLPIWSISPSIIRTFLIYVSTTLFF